MKKIRYALLCLFSGIYFTGGVFILFILLMTMIFRIGERKSIIEVGEQAIPPYPLGLQLGFFASLIAFLVLGCFLIYLMYKLQSKLSIKLYLKLILFVIPVFCGHLLAQSGIDYWYSIPPMSREEALQIAIEENSSTTSNIFKSIYWDNTNQRWVVKFTDQQQSLCTNVTIYRLRVSSSNYSCNNQQNFNE